MSEKTSVFHPPERLLLGPAVLVGLDTRAGLTEEQKSALHVGHGHYGRARADTVMLVHVSPGERGITVVSLPATGTLKLSGVDVTASQVIPMANLGNLTYAPAPNENGAKTFTVTAFDGSLSSAAATVRMKNTNTCPCMSPR